MAANIGGKTKKRTHVEQNLFYSVSFSFHQDTVSFAHKEDVKASGSLTSRVAIALYPRRGFPHISPSAVTPTFGKTASSLHLYFTFVWTTRLSTVDTLGACEAMASELNEEDIPASAGPTSKPAEDEALSMATTTRSDTNTSAALICTVPASMKVSGCTFAVENLLAPFFVDAMRLFKYLVLLQYFNAEIDFCRPVYNMTETTKRLMNDVLFFCMILAP